MLGRIVRDLKYSLSYFPGKKRVLYKWIVLRALNETLSPLMVPFIIRYMLDSYESQGNFIFCSFILLIILLPVFVLSYYIYVYSDAWVIKTMYEYQSNSLEKLCHISPAELDKNYSKGDMSYVINSGAWGMIQLWMKIFRVSGPLIGMLALLVYSLDIMPALFVILLAIILIDVIVAWVHTRINFRLNEKIAYIQGKKENELRYFLQDMEFLVMNDSVEREFKVNDDIVNDYWNVMGQMNIMDVVFGFGTEMLGTIFRGYIFNRVKLKRDKMTAGQVGTINQIFTNVRDSAGNARNQITTLPQLLVPVEKMNELMRSNEQVKMEELEWNEQGCISVQNICVKYEENNVLENLSLKVCYGDKIAIIGSNGSGKSTLLKTFLKINELNCGEIYVNDQRISEICDRNLRALFSYLPANLLLFKSSTRKNINMNGCEDYTNDELRSILQSASFSDDEIEKILQTKTQELSGGQAQRVSFGRMIARLKSIYLLDEPTSALDEENSRNVMEYVFQNLNTYIYTTHNAREIIYSNRVIYMEAGEIVCDLTKEQFLQSNYYFMWLGKNKGNGV